MPNVYPPGPPMPGPVPPAPAPGPVPPAPAPDPGFFTPGVLPPPQPVNPVQPVQPVQPIAPPAPPPAPVPVPPDGTLFNGQGQSLLNSHCATWRDQHTSLSVTNQMKKMAKCMGQDCEQSLETGNACRFHDANRLCYAYDSAQQWCAENQPAAASLCNDQGSNWGMPPFGSAAGVDAVEWSPIQNVAVSNPGASDPAVFSCSCMKNCGCSSSKCYCADPTTQPTPALPMGDPKISSTPMQMSSYSNKRGKCTCTCGGQFG